MNLTLILTLLTIIGFCASEGENYDEDFKRFLSQEGKILGYARIGKRAMPVFSLVNPDDMMTAQQEQVHSFGRLGKKSWPFTLQYYPELGYNMPNRDDFGFSDFSKRSSSFYKDQNVVPHGRIGRSTGQLSRNSGGGNGALWFGPRLGAQKRTNGDLSEQVNHGIAEEFLKKFKNLDGELKVELENPVKRSDP